jgi:hypothetical protein
MTGGFTVESCLLGGGLIIFSTFLRFFFVDSCSTCFARLISAFDTWLLVDDCECNLLGDDREVVGGEWIAGEDVFVNVSGIANASATIDVSTPYERSRSKSGVRYSLMWEICAGAT